MQYSRIWGIGLLASALTCSGPAIAGERTGTPRLVTHESLVEDVISATKLPLTDPVAMFAYVLGALPERVKVYPTENYYYFRFTHNKVPYAGNVRLDAMDRDLGKVHFAFYEDLAEWKDESAVTHIVLDMTQGVAVEKLDRLLYRISYRDKTVVFALNDLSGVVPPTGMVGPDERYVGPIFDEFRDPLLPDLQQQAENLSLHPRRNHRGWRPVFARYGNRSHPDRKAYRLCVLSRP